MAFVGVFDLLLCVSYTKLIFICPFVDGYVADEIVTSRAKVRVRVGNTDAEGRMVMADLLCYMKEQVGLNS